MRRSFSVVTTSIAIAVTLAACGDDLTQVDLPPQFEISDGAHGGNAHFFFLSPMVPAPSPTGTFDGSLEPVVEVCELAIDSTCGPPIVVFNTVTGPGSETIRVSPSDEQYLVNWHTRDFDLDVAHHYRIRVLLGNRQLGFADVDLVDNGGQLKNVATGEYIPLVDGRTLPIKFRIEEGALGTGELLSNGYLHSCALAADGAAYCTGFNNYGQLGDGTTNPSPTPVAVGGGHTFQFIATGVYHSCGVTTAGDALCWGFNGQGQLGAGTTTTSEPTPVLVAGGGPWQSIAAGYLHTCGLTTAGEVYCWGYNGNGELGGGFLSLHSVTPVEVAGGGIYSMVRALSHHTCAITTSGEGRCWGHNYYGQVGNGEEYPDIRVSTPTPVLDGHQFATIDAGVDHSCGSTTGGDVYCWGLGVNGQLGNGGFGSSVSPVAVIGASSVQSVRTGQWHSCAMTTAGEALCWGNNTYGQLGDGTTSPQTTAVAVLGDHVFETIDTGGFHTCGATTDGDILCWGRNHQGQLGTGSYGPGVQASPVASLLGDAP